MPRIIDYDIVLQTLLSEKFRSLYYNSGSFGFAQGVPTYTVGWIGPPDATIREEARRFTRQIDPPYGQNLTSAAVTVWREHIPGVVWAMPRSHWAYELDFGSREWMPAALREIGIDAGALAPLTTGAAIEFQLDEAEQFAGFLTGLLDNLSGSSDFQLAWPGRPIVCTVHHHKQLWWTISDAALLSVIERASRRAASL